MEQPQSEQNHTIEDKGISRSSSNESLEEEYDEEAGAPLDTNPPSIERMTRHKLATKRLREAYKLIMKGRRPPPGAPKQCPTLTLFSELTALEWHPSSQFDWATMLDENFPAIKDEYDRVVKDQPNLERISSNVSEGGEWNTFYLYNQGKRIDENCNQCPITTRIVESIPSLMSNCGLGYVYFSVIRPGTHITSHSGPTNLRLRCHLPLYVPEGCAMRVGSTVKQWEQGKSVIFDDSFDHEVWHKGTEGNRVVLLIDVWHPELTDFEKKVIKLLLP
jgi:aspartate beta-hydroxylase